MADDVLAGVSAAALSALYGAHVDVHRSPLLAAPRIGVMADLVTRWAERFEAIMSEETGIPTDPAFVASTAAGLRQLIGVDGEPPACEHEWAEILTVGGTVVRKFCTLCGDPPPPMSTPPPATWDEPSGYVWTSPQRWP